MDISIVLQTRCIYFLEGKNNCVWRFSYLEKDLVFPNQLFYVCEDNCETAKYFSRDFY